MTTQDELVAAYMEAREIALAEDDLTLTAFMSGAVATLGIMTKLFSDPYEPATMVGVTTKMLQLNHAVGNLKKTLRDAAE